MNYNYNYNKSNPSRPTKSSSIGPNLSLNLTKNWKIMLHASYDLIRKELNTPQIQIYRDLHCWEMDLSWTPVGTYRGFRFEIRMKAPEFRDLKVEKDRRISDRF